MIQKFKGITVKISIFWGYFFALSLIVGIFLLSLMMSASHSTQALSDSYLQQARTSFEQNCQMFSRDLFLSHALPTALENSEQYRPIAGLSKEQAKGKLYSISVLHGEYMKQCALLGMPSEGFVYFKNSGISFTHQRLFGGEEDCFDFYLKYDESVIGSIRDAVMKYENMGPRLLPCCDISVNGGQPEPYLTLLSRGTGTGVTYGFLYSQQMILDYFHLEALPEDTWLQLTHSDGTLLFSHGPVQRENYALMTAQVPSLSCTAAIGIPQSYFRQTIDRAQTVSRLIFLLSVVLGTVMCFVFSHAGVKPFRRLIQTHVKGQELPKRPVNELVVIDSVLRSARQKTDALQGMLLSSLMMRAYSGLYIPEAEYEKLAAAFPMFHQSVQAAVVRDRVADQDLEERSSVMDRLQDILPKTFLCEYINIQEALLLFPADEGGDELLQRAMMELNLEHEQEFRFVCGVSAPFVGLQQTGSAIRQARFCVPETEERLVVHFVEDHVAEAAAADDTDFDFKQFQQALASWNQLEVLAQIEQFALCLGKGGAARPEEVFYSVLFLLRDAANSGKISFEAHEKTAYRPIRSPMDNLRSLKEIANDLFEQKAALLMTDKQQLYQQIVCFIGETFGDANLCLASLAQQFGVSERFVYNAVQSVTGMNFSSYITHTRMQEAARLLRESDETIATVAERCGYPVESTFYRNFKKVYHITPVEYRNSAR